jgi:hypothetical protein
VTPVIVMLTRTTAREGVIPVFTAVLEDAVVGTVELVDVEGNGFPTERVTLRPRRATLTYQPPSPAEGTMPVTTVVNCH